MIMPDCRKKYARDAYPYGSQWCRREDYGEKGINPYWEQRLKGEDREFIRGFDACTEDAIGTFFSMAETYLDDDEIDYDVLDDERPIEEIPDEEKKSWNSKTRLLKKIKDNLLFHIEATRNEDIVVLIESGAYDEPKGADKHVEAKE